MQRMTLGLSATFLVLAGTAVAAPETGPAPETRSEAQANAGRLFDKLDLNHDGKLDQADRDARASQMAAHGTANEAAADHAGGHMGHWGYDHQELRGLVRLILHRADPEHSGAVSHDAFVGAALALFDQADTNHDGVLTADEYHAAAEAMPHHAHAAGDNPPPPGN